MKFFQFLRQYIPVYTIKNTVKRVAYIRATLLLPRCASSVSCAVTAELVLFNRAGHADDAGSMPGSADQSKQVRRGLQPGRMESLPAVDGRRALVKA